jgi:hypothetical protein
MAKKRIFKFIILGVFIILVNFCFFNLQLAINLNDISRRVKISSDIIIKKIPAQNHLAKVTLLNLAYLLGDALDSLTLEDIKSKANEIKLTPETVKLISQGIQERDIKKGLIMALIQQVLDKAGLDISFSDLNFGQLAILSERIENELLLTVSPENVRIEDGKYLFLIQEEEIPKEYLEAPELSYNEKIKFYKELGIKNPETARIKGLKIMDLNPYFVKYRLDKLQKFFDSRCKDSIRASNYLDLLFHHIGIVEKKANAIDRLVKEKGLKVSYRKEDGIKIVDANILTAYPDTIKENLALLRGNNIDEIRNYKLLYEVSIFKLSTNINFLKKIGMPLQVSLLRSPVLRLQNNYLILKILSPSEIKPKNLRLRTENLIERFRRDEIATSYDKSQLEILLSNIESFLSPQQDFYEWWLMAQDNPELVMAEELPEREFEQWRLSGEGIPYEIMQNKAIQIYGDNFGFEGLGELPPPSWSLFSLLTYINITGNLGSALIDFSQQCLLKGEKIAEEPLEEIINDLVQRYGLNSIEKERLEKIIRKERSFIPVREG